MNETTTETSTTGPLYALLVGVDDYQSFDPSGASNLRGSCATAGLLRQYGVLNLGLAPTQMRVLLSPGPGSSGATESAGLATLASVRAGLEWLLEVSKAPGARALFAFAGHGSWTTEGGAVLCLGDASPGLTAGVLSLRELGAMIERAGARERVVALLDCCHTTESSLGLAQVTALPHAGTPAQLQDSAGDYQVCDRVLAAAKLGEPAHQMLLGEHAHGAFTFALVMVAERWAAQQQRSTGSYGNVLARTRSVLQALGVQETPMLYAAPARYDAVKAEPFLGTGPGPTAEEPGALGRPTQVDPTYIYTLALAEKDLAVILATDTNTKATKATIKLGSNAAITSNAGVENWYVNETNLAQLDTSAPSLAISRSTLDTANNPQQVTATSSGTPTKGYSGQGGSTSTSTPYLSAGVASSWVTSAPSYLGNMQYHFLGTSQAGTITNLWVTFDVQRTSTGGGYTYQLKQVYWWVETQSTMSGTMNPADFSTFTKQSSAPGSSLQKSTS